MFEQLVVNGILEIRFIARTPTLLYSMLFRIKYFSNKCQKYFVYVYLQGYGLPLLCTRLCDIALYAPLIRTRQPIRDDKQGRTD